MARLKRALAVTFVNLIVLLCLLEGLSVAYLYARDGRLFYSRPRARQEADAADAGTQGGGPPLIRQILHPVLGYIFSPSLSVVDLAPRWRLDGMVGPGVVPGWATLKANNFGFFAKTDYPYAATDSSEYIIGIFGGSVAQWLSLQGAERLRSRLEESGLLPDRGVRILNFAQGGFKQPQQLLALGYFISIGQRFDCVVNVDGFNEVALAYLNATKQVDISMPSGQHVLPILAFLDGPPAAPEYLEELLAAKKFHDEAITLEELTRKNPSAFLQVLLELFRQRALARYSQAARALDALSADLERSPLVHVNAPAAGMSAAGDRGIYAEIAGLWMRSSMLMHRMLDGLGILYLHVLQPNQYSSGREFSAAEERIAIDPSSPYREPAAAGYPYLLSQLDVLQEERVNVVSAVGIFDEVDGVVYADSCCHYNQRGNEILADFIADRLIAQITESAPPPSGRRAP